MLGGVRIPHEHGLVGHSDADVGLHAIVDAIYGAIGAGDIGSHFPPGDERWNGMTSRFFVESAARWAWTDGFAIVHVDLTLVCERPAIAPHREAMRECIADMLEILPSQISVKATTTEGIGFTGRGEGIAAFAIATLVTSP